MRSRGGAETEAVQASRTQGRAESAARPRAQRGLVGEAPGVGRRQGPVGAAEPEQQEQAAEPGEELAEPAGSAESRAAEAPEVPP